MVFESHFSGCLTVFSTVEDLTDFQDSQKWYFGFFAKITNVKRVLIVYETLINQLDILCLYLAGKLYCRTIKSIENETEARIKLPARIS